MNLIATLALSAACAGQPERFEFTWTTPDGDDRTHVGVIDRPDEPNGFGVMLFGGGSTPDLEWTVPGVVEINGEVMQFTVGGEPTRDAATITEALTDEGFVVMRYDSVHEGDPSKAGDAPFPAYLPYDQTLALARRACAVLPERAGLHPSLVFAVGHSLGAPRAIHATGGEAPGYVTLAGAYLSRTNARSSVLSADALEHFDLAPPQTVTREAWMGLEGDLGYFRETDIDGNGELAGWELAAATLAEGEPDPAFRYAEEPWPVDIMIESGAPALAIWGGTDMTSVNARFFAEAPGVETRFFPELDHNLSRGEDHKVRPIEPEVVETIVAWLVSWAGARRLPDK